MTRLLSPEILWTLSRARKIITTAPTVARRDSGWKKRQFGAGDSIIAMGKERSVMLTGVADGSGGLLNLKGGRER